jgi:hypothetical protein
MKPLWGLFSLMLIAPTYELTIPSLAKAEGDLSTAVWASFGRQQRLRYRNNVEVAEIQTSLDSSDVALVAPEKTRGGEGGNFLVSSLNEQQTLSSSSSSPPYEVETGNSSLQTVEEKTDIPLSSSSIIQEPSVSELSDVQPTDWAFQTLQSLQERYRCLANYPNSPTRGNQRLTRYEFAARLKVCLDKVLEAMNEAIASKTTNPIPKEDWDALQRLAQDFSTELENLKNRIDTLERQTNADEVNQFSTTTKLRGEVDFVVAGAWGDKKAAPSNQRSTEDLKDTNLTFGGRVSLSFDSSFTGRDRLRTKIQAGNINAFDSDLTGTEMTRTDSATNTDNEVELDTLYYRFRVSDRAQVYLSPFGLGSDDIAPTLVSTPSISRFGGKNPIYRLSDGGGTGIYYQFNDEISASFAYLANDGGISNPSESRGLFNGEYGALAQVTYTPNDELGVSLIVAHHYSPGGSTRVNLTGRTGSEFAQAPFGERTATSAKALSVEASYRLSDRFTIGGWVGHTRAIAEAETRQNRTDVAIGSQADIWNWAMSFWFQDIGQRGNQLALIFGMPPLLASNVIPGRSDRDISYHIEVLYRHRMTDRISITPGFLAIINPEHNANNDDIWIGTVRINFEF